MQKKRGESTPTAVKPVVLPSSKPEDIKINDNDSNTSTSDSINNLK